MAGKKRKKNRPQTSAKTPATNKTLKMQSGIGTWHGKGLAWPAILGLSLLQALLSCFSFAPFSLPVLPWLMPWPFFFLASRLRYNTVKLIFAGVFSAFFTCLAAFHWMLYLMREFGGVPYPVGALIFLPYSILLNLKAPLFLFLAGLIFRSKPRRLLRPRWLALALAALLCDYLTPQIFPWYWGNLLAASDSLIAQIAELGGVYSITFLLFAGSYFLYRLAGSILKPSPAIRARRIAGRIGYRLAIVPTLLLGVYVWAALRKAHFESYQKTLPAVTTAILQPNAPLEKAGQEQVTPAVIGRIMADTIPRLANSASQATANGLDLIVLPESAVPYYSTQDNYLARSSNLYAPEFEMMALLLAYNYNADVFLNDIGIRPGRFPSGEPRIEATNSSALFGRDGNLKARYDKIKLLAFGEYVPGSAFLETSGLIEIVPDSLRYNRFYPGHKASLIPYGRPEGLRPEKIVLQKDTLKITPEMFRKNFKRLDRAFTPAGHFMPLICYEVIVPEILADFYGGGQNPGFMVNITQDGWYGRTIETYQHFELGRIRSIEHRRALVRATNSGSSGFVDLAGNYRKPDHGPLFSPQEAESFQVWKVPVNTDPPTLYVRYGNSWIFALSLGWVLSFILRWHRDRSRADPALRNAL